MKYEIYMNEHETGRHQLILSCIINGKTYDSSLLSDDDGKYSAADLKFLILHADKHVKTKGGAA